MNNAFNKVSPDASSIATVIVTFNPEISGLKNSLNLHLQTGSNFLFIIDNGSKNFPEIEHIIHKINSKNILLVNLNNNYGLAYAQNYGTSLAKKENYEFIAFFDQDSTPSENIVRLLAQEANALVASGIKLGAVGPTHIDSRTNSEYPLTKFLGPFLLKVWPHSQTKTVIEVDFLISSGSLIPLRSINNIGPMRTDFFIDGIDIEWCFRSKNMGYKIFAIRDLILFHSIGDKRVNSLGKEISVHSPTRRYYITRNSILLARSRILPIGARIWFLFSTILKSPQFLIAVRFKRDYVFATLRGLWHGFCGKTGSI